MARGKYALLIPSVISKTGVAKLVAELHSHRVPVVDKDDNLVLVKWDEKSRLAVAKGPSIQAYYTDRISPADVKRLPQQVARVALLWNWSINNRGKRITDGAVKRVMATLQLEVRQGKVYDRLTKKDLGNVESAEKEEAQGNWYIYQNRGWQRNIGWFGFWEKLWCKTRTYTSAARSSRLVVDYILAEVDGPQHYAHNHRHNGSVVQTYDWDYIWVGEQHCGTAFSYAGKGSSSASVTGRIC